MEGPQAAREADLLELFATADAIDRHPEITARRVHVVDDRTLESIAQTVTPQGLVGVAAFCEVPLDALAGAGFVAVLAGVRDPGNAGTILRVADAAGAGGVVFAGESVDAYNPKCVRASAGSIFHVPFVTGVPAAESVAALRSCGLRVLAADAGGRTELPDADLAGPIAWLFGNEAHGLSEDLLAQADDTVRVPIYGRAESLNLATAAAVCLYAAAVAHRRPR